ncbi:hypothetical protein DN069_11125 [Streptacidiphilus pinicola]|uniref:Putative restriction endonuclease domain-containing protein n=2 Tax=Streptacidiphilus pinicola TaxID=2219663 RepID=A0A2X0IK88_9ACTN|nr:hypothetical protein DN069_11125 [Streptacidiphilus pinicola]
MDRAWEGHTKRDLYARHGIPVYVIVDPRDATWQVFLLAEGMYAHKSDGVFGQTIVADLPAGTVGIDTREWRPYPEAERGGGA